MFDLGWHWLSLPQAEGGLSLILEEKTKFHIDNYYLDDPQTYGDITLYQIGRRYCEPGAVIGEHKHADFFELTVVTGGSATVYTNGVPYKVRSGDIFFSLPDEHHDLVATEGEKFEYDFFAFAESSPYGDELAMLKPELTEPSSRVFRDERISYLLALAIAEFSGGGEHGSDMKYCLMKEIILYTLRGLKNDLRISLNVSGADILCQNIMSYIDAHIYSITSLSEVAERFKYNYSYLSNLFKRTTGNTLSEYYRGRRLDMARSLIEEGKRTVGEISEMLGYSTPFAFSAAFKKRFSVAPKAYKPEAEQRQTSGEKKASSQAKDGLKKQAEQKGEL